MRERTVTQSSPRGGQTVTDPQGLNNRESVLLLSVKPLRSNSGGGERTFLTAVPSGSAN